MTKEVIAMVADRLEHISEYITVTFIGKDVYWVSNNDVRGPFTDYKCIENTNGFMFTRITYNSEMGSIQIADTNGRELTSILEIATLRNKLRPRVDQALEIQKAIDNLEHTSIKDQSREQIQTGVSYIRQELSKDRTSNRLFILGEPLWGIQEKTH